MLFQITTLVTFSRNQTIFHKYTTEIPAQPKEKHYKLWNLMKPSLEISIHFSYPIKHTQNLEIPHASFTQIYVTAYPNPFIVSNVEVD